tara:strand:+ start:340 stop:453 length:114 start_codon:yes stop_codon:yes gene_type:complete
LNLEILIGGAASRVREKRNNIIVWSIEVEVKSALNDW